MPKPEYTNPQARFHKSFYTQVPDVLFDQLLVELTGSELKVLLYIIRHTMGYKKESDRISQSQMLNGIVERGTGKRVDWGTGVSKPALLKSLRSLRKKNLIRTERQRTEKGGDRPTVYTMVFVEDEQAEGGGNKSYHGGGSKIDHRGGKQTLPGPVAPKLTTQETTNKQET